MRRTVGGECLFGDVAATAGSEGVEDDAGHLAVAARARMSLMRLYHSAGTSVV